MRGLLLLAVIVSFSACAQGVGNETPDETTMKGEPLAKEGEKEGEAFREPDQELLDKGKRLYQSYGCVSCHGRGGEGGERTPPLKELYGSEVELESGAIVTADEDYIMESILSPLSRVVKGYRPRMPDLNLTQSEARAVTAYIKSL